MQPPSLIVVLPGLSSFVLDRILAWCLASSYYWIRFFHLGLASLFSNSVSSFRYSLWVSGLGLRAISSIASFDEHCEDLVVHLHGTRLFFQSCPALFLLWHSCFVSLFNILWKFSSQWLFRTQNRKEDFSDLPVGNAACRLSSIHTHPRRIMSLSL